MTAETSARRPITVIVPVYGDLPSLIQCVESLMANVDFTVDSVLLVNDCGPDADLIETELLARISDHPGFRYERNELNLGFVGACNRAATVLDTSGNDVLLLNSDTVTTAGFLEELGSVLHLAPNHGIVCARSNNATIASLPYTLRDPSSARSVERTAEVHAALSGVLRRFTISPVAMGFCLLVRRELIDRHGLFDEVFAPGYGEENDFCLRMNALGYSSLIAHRALVFHIGSRSFVGARRNALRSAHEAILRARHPGYAAMIQSYLRFDRDPVDVFADALVASSGPRKVLIVLDEAVHPRLDPLVHELAGRTSDVVGVTVAVPDRVRAKVAGRVRPTPVIGLSALNGLWDAVVFDPSAIDRGQLETLNEVSPRWILVDEQNGTSIDWPARVRDPAQVADYRRALAGATAAMTIGESAGGRVRSIDESLGAGTFQMIALDAHIDGFADAVLEAAVDDVDAEHLRARWTLLTDRASAAPPPRGPREPPLRRLARRADSAAPRAAGFARRVIRPFR